MVGAWPTQGGGGVDHLAKVQQKKAQTERHFFHPLGYLPPEKVTLISYNKRYEQAQLD